MRFVIAIVIATSVAVAQPAETAEQHHQHGKELFKAKDFAGAVTEFAAAYAQEPLPKYLFNLAQAQRFSGDCKAAIDSYQKFLTTGPEQDDVEFANAGIEKCKEMLPVAPVVVCGDGVIAAPESCDDGRTDDGDGCSATCAMETGWTCVGAPSACSAIPVEHHEVEPVPVVRKHSDVLGKVLIGTSTGLAITGVAFYALARGVAAKTDDPQPIDDYNDKVGRATRDRGIAVVAGSLSAAAAIGAIVFYATRSSHEVVVEPTAGGGAAVRIGGRF